MINKELDKIAIEDIQELIENSVSEGKTIEYKEKISISGDEERKEFLYDISSFSNASGGDLIFGIKEDKETGYPLEIIGIKVDNTDKLQLQIESMIRDSISPRLPGVNYKFLKLTEDSQVLIIRIVKSWNKPHQVTYRKTDKFYSRDNKGKYKLDVFELRNAFLAADSLRQNIHHFRNERLTNIIANEGAVPLLDNGKIILQIVPFISFETGNLIDLKELYRKNELLRPIGELGFLPRYNFDGILSYVSNRVDEPNAAYLQVFKNGIIESVNSWVIQPNNDRKQLFIESIEEIVIYFMHRVHEIYKIINIEPPIVALLTLTGVQDFELGTHDIFFSFDNKKVGKDILIFQDILIEEWKLGIDEIIKPWCDSLWNAVGFDESKSYVNGKWTKWKR